VWVLGGLKHQGVGSHQVDLAGFTQRKNPQNRLGFNGDAQLRLGIEWALYAAHVEGDLHAKNLHGDFHSSNRLAEVDAERCASGAANGRSGA
jgi:hypothetical protein